MEEKNKLFTNLLVYGFLIFLTVPIYRTFKDLASDDNPNLSNSKASIIKTSDEIFNSKLNEAKIKGLALLRFEDGGMYRFREGSEDFKFDNLLYFSTKIQYDKFLDKFDCTDIYHSVDPISKDIKIDLGTCHENDRYPDCDDDKFDNYIYYRANDEKNIRYYDPKIVIESNNRGGLVENKYYKVLPYSFFKDFKKIALRYYDVYKSLNRKGYGITRITSEFDTNSVLIINNLQKRCGIKKSIF